MKTFHFKVVNGEPKRDTKTICGTGGSPKDRKIYGDRGIIVPNISTPTNRQVAGNKERIPVNYIRKFSSTARNSSTVSTDGMSKLRKISELCSQNPDFIVNKIYNVMYDRNVYEIAYNKLKSKPGNMTPGITPTTLR